LGTGNNDVTDNLFYQYEHPTRTFEVKTGGGVGKKVNTCGLIGAGIYYNYLQNKDDVWFFRNDEGSMPKGLSFPCIKNTG
jgi:hypothetical protein